MGAEQKKRPTRKGVCSQTTPTLIIVTSRRRDRREDGLLNRRVRVDLLCPRGTWPGMKGGGWGVGEGNGGRQMRTKPGGCSERVNFGRLRGSASAAERRVDGHSQIRRGARREGDCLRRVGTHGPTWTSLPTSSRRHAGTAAVEKKVGLVYPGDGTQGERQA